MHPAQPRFARHGGVQNKEVIILLHPHHDQVHHSHLIAPELVHHVGQLQPPPGSVHTHQHIAGAPAQIMSRLSHKDYTSIIASRFVRIRVVIHALGEGK